MKHEFDRMLPSIAEEISATYAARNFSTVRRKAHAAPVIISSHHKDRQVLMAFELYELLGRRGTDHGMVDRLNAKLSLTLDSIDTYVCILDDQCRIKRMNNAFLAGLGKDDSSTNGRVIDEIFAAPSFCYVIERIHEVLDSQIPARFEQPSPLDPEHILSFRIKPWPGGVGIFADDVTEQTIARENKARMASLGTAIASFGDTGLGTIDAVGTIVDASHSFADLIGAQIDSLKGSKFGSLFAPSSRGEVEAAVRMASGVQMLDVELLVGGVRVQRAKLALAAYWNGAAGHSHGFVVRTD